MTKIQVKNKINSLITKRRKELAAEIDSILAKADMWYGNDEGAPAEEARRWIVNRRNMSDRNGDQFISDGLFTRGDVEDWLHTRSEMGL